jgi:phenylacetate-CoA ligase
MNDKTIFKVKKIIKNWPAYRKFVENSAIDLSKIKNLTDLPILDRQFIANAIHTVPLVKVRNIVPSSGSTGADFSFGLFGDIEMRKTLTAIEEFLGNRFNTKNKKTLLLNLLPGAISLQSSTVSVASIGVRMDTAISAIKTLGSSFEQIILVGEPLFIKNLVEYGQQQSIFWKYMPLFIMVGGEWISESYRNYLEGMVGYQRVYSSMGMAELGLNYFYETDETVMLRHLLFQDRHLLKMLLGEIDFCPMLFVYDEDEIFVETVKEHGDALESILLTTVDSERILPLIRYKSGDKGKILSRLEINKALIAAGYMELQSTTGPPLLAHFGRGKSIRGIYPEKIKEIIYSSDVIASSTTGNFLLSNGGDIAKLEVQLKQNVHSDFILENMYRNAFHGLPVHIKLYSFEIFPNPLDFERKVQYVFEGVSCKKRKGEKTELSIEV